MSPEVVLPKEERLRETARFPVRVACVDAGSNAIRFIVAEFTDRARWGPLVQERAPVRLGHNVFLTGRLSERAMSDAVAAFRSFRQHLDNLEVRHCRAVATSAVRESTNGNAFQKRVRRESGIRLETITGSEEARLVHQAIQSRLHLGKEPWVAVDLGGGSVEVSLVDGSGILWSESHTMGSVRLLEELSGAGKSPGQFRTVLSEYISTLRIPSARNGWKPAGLVATGGNIESLAQLAGADPDSRRVSILLLRDLQGLIEKLARLSYRKRVTELGLREDRADVILPAAMVYERLAVLSGVDRLHVPNVGVKEGVLLDLVDSLSGQESHEERAEREVVSAAVNLGRRYLFDEEHGLHVAHLSRQLFDQLQPVHKMPAARRKLLAAAAILHDVGSYISRKKHHRHSHYLIANSEIAGLSPQEIQLVAAVALHHRKGDPDPHREPLSRFEEEEREQVAGLAALLRIADALDREHRRAVKGIRVAVREDDVLIDPDIEGDILLERWSFKRRAQLFNRMFKKTARVRTDEDSRP